MLFFRRRHPISDAELSAYVDGELPAADNARVEAHVESCDPCRQTLLELRAVRQSVRDLPRAAAPRSFALREADVHTAAPAPAGAFSGAPGLLGAVATMAVLVFGVLVAVDVGGTPAGGGAGDSATNMLFDSANEQAGLAPAEALGGEDGDAPLPEAAERDLAGQLPEADEGDGASRFSGVVTPTGTADTLRGAAPADEAEDGADDAGLTAREPDRDVADGDEAEADPATDSDDAEPDPPAEERVVGAHTFSFQDNDCGISSMCLAEVVAAGVAVLAATAAAFVWWRRRA